MTASSFYQFFLVGFTFTAGLMVPSISPCSCSKAFDIFPDEHQDMAVDRAPS